MTVYEQYKALTFSLAVLDRAGLLESEAAEFLRVASDACWKNMTVAERQQGHQFAGSLT